MSGTVEKTGSDVMLQPGQVIRPQMTESTARHLVESLYGLKVTKIKELNSYDDRNFKVEVDPEFTNPNVDKLWPHGYILKVLNSMDSTKNHIAAEHEAQHLLVKAGIQCPIPVLDVEGRDRSLQRIDHPQSDDQTAPPNETPSFGCHVVRLLTFTPGDIIADYDVTPTLVEDAGAYLARFLLALKDFSHEALTSHQTVWNLIETPRVEEFLYAVEDPQRRQMVQEVIQDFREFVLPNVHSFQKGIIHGDYNEQNLLVEKSGSEEGCTIIVSGVIDFGDMTQSYHLFDLAIAIMYMSINCKTKTDHILAGGHVVAGFYRHASLSAAEWGSLRTCVAARYCQSLVMGAYSYQQDPGNEYLLVTSKAGWTQLRRLWDTPKEDLYKEWFRIIKEANPSVQLPELQSIL